MFVASIKVGGGYIFTLSVCLSACLSVCQHDTSKSDLDDIFWEGWDVCLATADYFGGYRNF